MKNHLLVLGLFCLLVAGWSRAFSQPVVVSADGPGNTYELLNSRLAPTGNVVEAPDAIHSSFGRHIREVFDSTLQKFVFEFILHVTPDNDISTMSPDRQRLEIKTYASSPANLIGTVGETVVYKWKFRIPVGLQPTSRFTHIHQIKPVGGEDDQPIYTLTARRGTPNRLELNYVPTGTNTQVRLAEVPLAQFEGQWVEATEIITIGQAGRYSIQIERISDGATLISYTNNNMETIRPTNTFIRPKWGIYRSLEFASELRDEILRFADFSIAEQAAPQSPNTYYWIGGTGPSSFTANSNWNTMLDGTGDSRSVAGAQPDDVLIFDGGNLGGLTPTTGTATVTITSASVGRLKFQNNAQIIFQRPAAGGGTGTITIAGTNTPDPDFVITEGASLTVNSPLSDGSVVIALSAAATGRVSGTCTFSNTGTHRITSQTVGGLVFAAGSTFQSAGTPASAAYPFGSNSQAVNNGVVFQAGANLIFSGNRSPFGGTSTFQACQLLPGSNFFVRASNPPSTGSYTNLKTLGNLFIQNNAVFTADGPFYKIDTLVIESGATLVTHSSGNTPVLGDLVVDGILRAPTASTNVLVMGGAVPQTIRGTGSLVTPSFTVANNSRVRLMRSVQVLTTTNIVGLLDFGQAAQITGTATFTSRVSGSATTVTGNITEGSFQVTGVTGALSGNVGLRIQGNGLADSTNVVGFSSSNAVINLSKPAAFSATGVTFDFVSDSATLVTAHPNGLDSLLGSVIVTGNKSFQSGTNYVINGKTTSPFGISSDAGSFITLGRVVVNDSITSHYNTRIRGGLFVLAGDFLIRSTDTVEVFSGSGGRMNSLPPQKETSGKRIGNKQDLLARGPQVLPAWQRTGFDLRRALLNREAHSIDLSDRVTSGRSTAVFNRFSKHVSAQPFSR